MLNWTSTAIQVEQSTNATVLKGTYQAPARGAYFLKIIAVFCHDFLRNDQSDKGVQPWDTGVNFKHTCVKEPTTHRLTERDASISVVKEWTTPAAGHWVVDEQATHTPLNTRFQPRGCRVLKRKPVELGSNCTVPMSLKPFKRYSFHWNQDLTVRRLQQKTPAGICFVGDSHTRIVQDAPWFTRSKGQ
jgi:hypothetical protein